MVTIQDFSLTDEHTVQSLPTTSQDISSVPCTMMIDAPEFSNLDLLATASPPTETPTGQGNWDSGHESSQSNVEQSNYREDFGCTDAASCKRRAIDDLSDGPDTKRPRLTATENSMKKADVPSGFRLSSDVQDREMLEDGKSALHEDADDELDYEDCGEDVCLESCSLDDGVAGVGEEEDEMYDVVRDYGYDDVVVVDGDELEGVQAAEVDDVDGNDSGHDDDGLENFLSDLNSVELIGEISDSSEDEDDCIPCPESCICKSGQRDSSIPYIDRRFETIQPLRQKLLTRQTLSRNKLLMSSCCEYECCSDWNRISADEVVCDYDPSDLNVLHFSWGVWKQETDDVLDGESEHGSDGAVEEVEQMNESVERDEEDGDDAERDQIDGDDSGHDATDGLEDFLSELNSVDLIGEISDSSDSENEDDCIPCPDSCICNSGQQDVSVPEIKRRFQKIRPLREKLLTWQTLRWDKLLTSSCCDRKCYLMWNTISGRRVLSDYHPSDVNVLHFGWGYWKPGVTDDSNVDDYQTHTTVMDHHGSDHPAMNFSREEWMPDVLADTDDDDDDDDEDYLSWTS